MSATTAGAAPPDAHWPGPPRLPHATPPTRSSWLVERLRRFCEGRKHRGSARGLDGKLTPQSDAHRRRSDGAGSAKVHTIVERAGVWPAGAEQGVGRRRQVVDSHRGGSLWGAGCALTLARWLRGLVGRARKAWKAVGAVAGRVRPQTAAARLRSLLGHAAPRLTPDRALSRRRPRVPSLQ